jgi:hypothetical protein
MGTEETELSYDLGLVKPWTYSRIEQRFLDSFRVALARERVEPGELQRARVIGGFEHDTSFSEEDLVAILRGDNPLLSGLQLERIGYGHDSEFGGLVSGRAPDFYEEAGRRWLAKRQKVILS